MICGFSKGNNLNHTYIHLSRFSAKSAPGAPFKMGICDSFAIKVLQVYYEKQPSQMSERAVSVLRTGIELCMIISKLSCLQAELQAVKDDFS